MRLSWLVLPALAAAAWAGLGAEEPPADEALSRWRERHRDIPPADRSGDREIRIAAAPPLATEVRIALDALGQAWTLSVEAAGSTLPNEALLEGALTYGPGEIPPSPRAEAAQGVCTLSWNTSQRVPCGIYILTLRFSPWKQRARVRERWTADPRTEVAQRIPFTLGTRRGSGLEREADREFVAGILDRIEALPREDPENFQAAAGAFSMEAPVEDVSAALGECATPAEGDGPALAQAFALEPVFGRLREAAAVAGPDARARFAERWGEWNAEHAERLERTVEAPLAAFQAEMFAVPFPDALRRLQSLTYRLRELHSQMSLRAMILRDAGPARALPAPSPRAGEDEVVEQLHRAAGAAEAADDWGAGSIMAHPIRPILEAIAREAQETRAVLDAPADAILHELLTALVARETDALAKLLKAARAAPGADPGELRGPAEGALAWDADARIAGTTLLAGYDPEGERLLVALRSAFLAAASRALWDGCASAGADPALVPAAIRAAPGTAGSLDPLVAAVREAEAALLSHYEPDAAPR